MFEDITAAELMAILADVPPVELKALALMRQATVQPGQIFPRGLDREDYIEAFGEWMKYINACTESAKLLIGALPTIAAVTPTEDYPL